MKNMVFWLGCFFVAIGIAKAVVAGILYLRNRRDGNAN